MPHTNYDYINIRPFREGQLASASPKLSRSDLNETGGLIPWGRVIVLDGTTKKPRLPSATGQTVLGISWLVQIYENELNGNSDSGVPNGSMFDYVAQAEIAVFVEETIVVGDPVYFRHTANGAGKAIVGRFRNDADTNTCDLFPNSRWIQGATAGNLAVLAINLP